MKRTFLVLLLGGLLGACASSSEDNADNTHDSEPQLSTDSDSDTGSDNTVVVYDTDISTDWDTYPPKGDGLALTPPMGWNSWNRFKSTINEQLIRDIADAMVSSGMRDVGYQYINIDDTWMNSGETGARDENGVLMADPLRFPNGIKALADYIHTLGLKIGIYGDRGTATCSNIPESGSYGYETLDAQTFAGWGIDYLKYDNCNPADGRDSAIALQDDYEVMSAALRASGRPFVFSLCAWSWQGEWMISAGHLWRSTGDISDCWSNEDDCYWRKSWENGIVDIIDTNADMWPYAGPGHWNDPDMLEVGVGHLSNTEYTAHFSIWAIMAAPLIAGNDLTNMDQATIDILTNTEVIAVDQDPAGIQGTRVADWGVGDHEVWMKPLHKPDGPMKAVVLFNRGEEAADITANFSDLDITGTAMVRDLWKHEDLGDFTDSFTATVPAHGVVMVKMVDISE
ncbi:MAG: glycoside hydrolase family 27 protein [Deltaproteobacteria bacterium]|nr:glycoside hydrolase family 27 protein [Deltaproteobacteria bacterium]MBN2674027.1 glycoside hydrolase family 27 protein [Deltaproteobacteria bacterium]